ncbi:recombination protein RecR [Endozoicomonas sp. SM1973]|uniref:Recombination protein RecR n=1 Tax=Spartinivicinus marinus TaxID=2994442 RepID=A0A853I5B8_9GAMM|nr:recombination mediator RecR [Spartinivicinus marinus]MCX4029204.1 recombination mediator RecR [Spartinivicinus marinus]NYZ65888.1 recombination protein RecR [Spartinivicinus marinus]
MSFSPLISELIAAFRCLPGVGPKSAQRMALHLLERDRHGALQLSYSLQQAANQVGNCQQCRTLCETTLCPICSSSRRQRETICVVETPADVLAIEQAGGFSGLYFVLMGHLSPLEGIGPEQLGLDQLIQRVKQDQVEELILATNPTVEGETTAHYIADQLQGLPVSISRIAHGIPLGGELEYVDGGTLAHALAGRKPWLVND